jgi:ferredoxin
VESRFSATPVATNGDDARLSGDVMSDEEVRVWIEQKLCTGDGLCTQYAPDVFEFGGDGLAYVKADGKLLTSEGSQTDVPEHLRLDVIDAADECPGNCIHVVRRDDGVEVAGPDAG